MITPCACTREKKKVAGNETVFLVNTQKGTRKQQYLSFLLTRHIAEEAVVSAPKKEKPLIDSSSTEHPSVPELTPRSQSTTC